MAFDNIKSLWLYATYQCPARCAHCLVDGRPEHGAWMSLEDAESYIDALAPLQYVGIVGGEVLLKPDLTIAIGRLAKEKGVPKFMIAGSNCCWATNDERTRGVLSRLKEAEIDVGFSMDAFHQEYIPVENVKRACRIARELGMGNTDRPDAVVLESMAGDNQWDRETRRLAETFVERGFGVDI
ncbi:radical SAM protein, partial [Candidatus Hydrogenedentota bacterium]